MPIFEYICKECGKRFETIVTGSKKAKCPACDSGKLEQQLSSFAVGSVKGKSEFAKSAGSSRSGGCGLCGDPRGPGSCSLN